MLGRGWVVALIAALVVVGACSDSGMRSSHASTTTTASVGAGSPGGNGGTGRGGHGGSSGGIPCRCAAGQSASAARSGGNGASSAGAGGASTSVPPGGVSTSTAPGSVTTAPCTRASTGDRTNVSYGPSDLDIYPVPNGCATPIVVFVHGGGYCCCDKSQDIGVTVPWFHSQGWAVVSVNYRLHVPYPAFDDDVATAVAWLHANAASFGGDANHIALFGHSTGAEMVAEIATNPTLQAASGGVACVAALDGYAYDLDLTMARISAPGRATYTTAYGSTAAQWRAASAVTYATPGHRIPPFLVVLRGGDTGSLLPLQQALVDALRGAGVSVQTIDAHTIGHGAVIHDIGRAGDRVMTAPVQAFLQHCR